MMSMAQAHIIIALLSAFLALVFGFLFRCIRKDLRAFERMETASVDDEDERRRRSL